jgi:hypothetical protein
MGYKTAICCNSGQQKVSFEKGCKWNTSEQQADNGVPKSLPKIKITSAKKHDHQYCRKEGDPNISCYLRKPQA